MIKKIAKKALGALNIEIARSGAPATVFFEVDEEFNSLYKQALEKTQLSHTDNIFKRQRNHTLIQLLKTVLAKGNVMNVAECGCWRGSSAYQIGHWLKKYGFKNKFYIFDSFEGLSDFQAQDLVNNSIKNKDERKKEFACSAEEVRENLREYDFVEYKKGWIPERFTDADKETFSFVHIDVDLYRPIKDSIEFFYPRMVSGGVIAFDDYGYLSFPGAKRAVDEFMSGREDFFLHLPSGEAFIIKK